MSSVKVAVRVRPFNKREMDNKAENIIQMSDKTTAIQNPKCPDDLKSFSYDYSYNSHDPKSSDFADQEKVYRDLGDEMTAHSFNGYNVCIFAYGQTGSGKSYTMMGTRSDPGLIPKLCNELFTRITSNAQSVNFSVEVSYMEIYCERVRDLLNPSSANKALRVREHPIMGPYVEGLSKLAVKDYTDVAQIMDDGNKTRTVAATNMNATSSRSHAVFSLIFSQRSPDDPKKINKVSKISLVDLAGSERANSTGASGTRLKEGANINQSLTTLGKVISALAEAPPDVQGSTKRRKKEFVPYRDSVLTWLLKESLGGNSKTAMIAAVSPADINYEETLSTLRYADRAKRIRCHAVVNEDPNAKLVRELRAEVERLKTLLVQANPEIMNPPDEEGPAPKSSRAEAMIESGPDGAEDEREKTLQDLQESAPKKSTSQLEMFLATEKAAERRGSATQTSPQGTGETEVKSSLSCAEEEGTPSSPDLETIKSIAAGIDTITLAKRSRHASVVDGSDADQQAQTIKVLKQLEESENLINELSEPWEVKLKRSEELRSQRMAILKEMGVALRDDTSVSGVFSPKSIPHLVNLNEDPFMSECLLYYLKVNAVTYVGTATLPADIVLSGTGITSRHAVFEYVLKDGHGEVFLSSCPEANTFVNGRLLEGRMKLKTGSRIIFGAAHVFRFVHPTAENCDESFVDDLPPDEPDNLAEVDWEYATKEIMDQWGIDLKAEKMEMHMKLQEAHSKLEEEQERAAIALEIQREEYEKKIKSLEFQVNIARSEARGVLGWTPRQIRLAKYSWDKWRKYQFTSLRDQIWGHAVLIKEANAIAAELNKQVEFQFSLLRDGLYTPIPSDITTPNPGQSVLVVEVRDKLHGALHYWSLEKLQVRLDGMRKMYELASEPNAANKEPNFPTNSRKSSIASDVSMPVTPKRVLEPIVNPMHQLHPDDGSLERPQWLRLVGRLKSASMSCLSEAGGRLMSPSSPISPHVPMSPQIDMANSATGMETALFSLLSSSDAFYDRTPWFNPIGRGSQPLYHLIPSVQDQEEMVSFQHRVRIISGHGELKGAVLIKTESLPKAEIANVGCIILLGDEALSDDGAEWSPDNGSTFSGEEELKFPIGERVIEGCSSPEGQAALYEEDDDNTTVWGLRLTIETLDLLPEEYSDAFCQFTIFGRCEESWSTEPIPITAGSATANATWELAVRAGSDLIRALRTTSIVLEVFGHSSGSSIPPFPHRFTDPDPAISFLPAFSKPVPVSSLYGPGGINQGGQTHSRHDILAWFELLELDVSGDYKAVPVEHGPERSRGMFLLHHGVQRKVALTITHESSAHLRWAEVCEVVVGRVRAREDGQSGMGDMPLSLPVTTSMCSQFGGDRTCYRVEAVWDSSLHNSDLLNRPGGQIWLTISAYVDLQQCTQPVCISRDVCVQVFPRDARLGQCRSLRQLLSPRNGIPAPSTDANRISSIFEISLRYQNLSPRSSRPILDTASQYVKGVEYLTSWRPKWDGLILEHQNLLRRLQHLQDLEKIRHWLHANDVDYPVSQRGMFGPTCQPGTFEPFQADQELDEDSYTPEETATLRKTLGLMFHKFPSVFVQNSYFATSSNCQSNGGKDGDSGLASVDSLLSNSPSLSSMRSRASDFTSMSCLTIPLDEPLDPPLSSPGVGPSTSSNNVSNQTRQMIPCVESVVMNPVISRRGYLLVLEQGSSHWTRRFVVVRRPYLLFYRSARDPVERSVINLSTAVVEYSADKQDVFRTPYIFAVSTQARALLLAAGSEAEANGWLYAFNPLLAASKKYYEMGHSSRLAEK